MDDYRPKWLIDIVRANNREFVFFWKIYLGGTVCEIFTYNVVLYKEERDIAKKFTHIYKYRVLKDFSKHKFSLNKFFQCSYSVTLGDNHPS
jgi:hypothetical protein